MGVHRCGGLTACIDLRLENWQIWVSNQDLEPIPVDIRGQQCWGEIKIYTGLLGGGGVVSGLTPKLSRFSCILLMCVTKPPSL